LRHSHDVDAPVPLPAGLIVFRAYRALLAIADQRELTGGDSHLDEEILSGRGPSVAQRQVVLSRTPLVAVSLNGELVVRVVRQDVPKLGRIGFQGLQGIGADGGLVVVEIGILNLRQEFVNAEAGGGIRIPRSRRCRWRRYGSAHRRRGGFGSARYGRRRRWRGRDFLLAPDSAAAMTEASRLAALEIETRGALTAYSRSLEAQEKEPFLALRSEIEAYWRVLDGTMAWSPGERNRLRYSFFYNELVPRRTAMLQIADRVAAVHKRGLSRAEERLAASADSLAGHLRGHALRRLAARG